jgi:hypothetical protein
MTDFDSFFVVSWFENGVTFRSRAPTKDRSKKPAMQRFGQLALPFAVAAIGAMSVSAEAVAATTPLIPFGSHQAAAHQASDPEIVPANYWPKLIAKIAALPGIQESGDEPPSVI